MEAGKENNLFKCVWAHIAILQTLGHMCYSVGHTRATICPSGVRALPFDVAAERSVHYIWFSSSFPPHTFLPEGVVLGL